MKRIALCLGFLASLASPALAQKTKAALSTEINTNFADNTTGAITPAILRATTIDIVNSYVDYSGSPTFACATSKWVSSGTLSVLTCTQPSFPDITGTVSLSQGGTNASLTASIGGIVYSTASAFAVLPGIPTPGQCLLSGASAAPTWGSCPGGGGGSGTVNAGVATQVGYYAGTGTTISGNANVALNSAGNWTFAPTSGDALTVNTAAASGAKGFKITQSGPTAGSVSSPFSYNNISITSDQQNPGASGFVYGQYVTMTTGGANSEGTQVALIGELIRTAAHGSNSVDSVALAGRCLATGFNGGGVEDCFGLSAAAVATNVPSMDGITGAEIDVGMNGTTTAFTRIGVSVVSAGNVQASGQDAGVSVTAAPTFSAWKTAYLVSASGVGSTSCVLCDDGNSKTILTGIDLSHFTITGNLINSSNFHVTGDGSIIGSSLGISSATGSAITWTDGSATGVAFSGSLFTHSVEIGSLTGHNLVFLTNNTMAGYFDTTQNFNVVGNITTPKVYGGSSASSTLNLVSTSGVGTTDLIDLNVGSNGATRGLRVYHSGGVGVGAVNNDPGVGNLSVLTTAAVGVQGIVVGRTFTVGTGAGQPTFGFYQFTAPSSGKMMGWIYDGGIALPVPGLVVQDLADDGSFISNGSVFWRHGGLSLGGNLTGGSLADPGSGVLHQWLTTDATTTAAASVVIDGGLSTVKRIVAGTSLSIGSATSPTLVTGELGYAKISASGSAPGAGTCKEEWVAGTGGGTCKKIAYCGTSTTPVTIVDNVGGSC